MPSLLNFVILVFFIFQKRNPYNKREYKKRKESLRTMAKANNNGKDPYQNYSTGINDLQFEKQIKEQRNKQMQEQAALERLEKKEERKEKINAYKKSSVPIYKMKKSYLLTILLCLILSLFALFKGFFSEAIFTFIAGVGTLIVGQNLRIGNSQPKLTNTILYNLSKSISDFIDYKIPYEIFENEDRWMDTYTILGSIIFICLPSDNILYGLMVVMLMLVFIVAFAMRDMQSIYSHTRLLVPACFIGIIVKVVFQYIYMGMVDIDLANIVLINVFSVINVLSKDLEISKPY